jgi:glutamate racemase
MSPVAGTELIEESDIPIVEFVEPQAVKAKAATNERVIKVFLNNLSPRFDSYLHYISL